MDVLASPMNFINPLRTTVRLVAQPMRRGNAASRRVAVEARLSHNQLCERIYKLDNIDR